MVSLYAFLGGSLVPMTVRQCLFHPRDTSIFVSHIHPDTPE
ncbi:hypothetical protein HMPREF9997_01019 [Corynebacterium durum F0235]|uniref:Uncharacterized protein n=1 Tax=Corynebacterium durum F0235 TaxID=1035195 RepID=L1MI58_9CORY|nr:hypothetical protein HMPREF9997_01019 [Corynebacterium durum F0235]